MLAGTSNSTDINGAANSGSFDCYIVKLDPIGDTEWQRLIGEADDDVASSIKHTPDGGYVFAGESDCTERSCFYVAKIDTNGAIDWEKRIAVLDSAGANAILANSDGTYLVSGHAGLAGQPPEGRVLKLNADGDVLWEVDFPDQSLGAIDATEDGGYVVAGTSDDCVLTKVSSSGDIVWQFSYGGSRQDESYSVIQIFDGGYLTAGHTRSSDIEGAGRYKPRGC